MDLQDPKQRFIHAIAFCLASQYGGQVEDYREAAEWALTPDSGPITAPHADKKVALVTGGATKIKGYVFESARLPEIRGASGLLDRINLIDTRSLWGILEEWNEDTKTQANVVRLAFKERTRVEPLECPDCVIYANGGEILAFAPVSVAPELADEIELIYTRETLVAQSVAVWQAFELKQLCGGLLADKPLSAEQTAIVERLLGYNLTANTTFGSLVAQLALTKFRRREVNPDSPHSDGTQSKPRLERALKTRAIAHFETVPFARRCSSCERRGAVVNAKVAPDEDRPLCEPCARKRVFGQLAKKDTAPEAIEWWDNEKFQWNPGPVRSWAREFTDAHPDIGEVEPPDDLNEIGGASKPEGFIGVIYADGNNMGGLLENLPIPTDYHEFASQVYATTKSAVFDALAGSFRKFGSYPFEILSIGGDDLFLVVPAHVALKVACDIARLAEGKLRNHQLFEHKEGYDWEKVHRCQKHDMGVVQPQSTVSFSAGVVLADAHTPIFYLEELAGQLLKSAKRRAKWLKRERQYYGGTIDFLALKSVTMISGTVEQFRTALLIRGNRRLYARPYTIAEMETLLDGIRLLKQMDFPRSQLYRLRGSLRQSQVQSTIEYLYFLSRDDKVRKAREKIEGQWNPNKQMLLHPWRRQLESDKQDDEYETIWYDLVELYDFVPKEEGGNANGQD
jgi:CRISPR-associated protein Cmr2